MTLGASVTGQAKRQTSHEEKPRMLSSDRIVVGYQFSDQPFECHS